MASLKSRFKEFTKKITKSSAFLNFLGSLIYWYTRLVDKSSEWKLTNHKETFDSIDNGQNIILVAWHGRALMLPTFQNGRTKLDALVSLHNDGQIIAGLLKRYQIGVIGGSTNNNARGAAINLMHSLNNGRSVCIIPDGPRGPRMKMSMSPIYYAWKTGCPIIGVTYCSTKCKIIESAWDKMLIPLPFGKIRSIFTEPFYIPAETPEEELDKYRLIFEHQLNEINFAVDKDCGISPILPSNEVRIKRRSTRDKGEK